MVVPKRDEVAQMLLDTYNLLKNPSEYLTSAALRRSLKTFSNSNGVMHEVANNILHGLTKNKDETSPISLQEWMVFFQKEFDPDEKLGKEDIEEIRVILGIWPLDNVVRQECQKMFYSVKSKEAPTSAHLAKLAATMLEDVDVVQEITDSIVFDFIPDYMENRILTLSEWMGFFARFALALNRPVVQDLPEMRRALRRVRPTMDKVLDSTPVNM